MALVGPWLLQLETHALLIWDLHGRHTVFESLARRAPISLKGIFHVLGRNRFTVVELDTLAQNELIDESVVRKRPRFSKAGCKWLARHRLNGGVVQRVIDHVRRDDPSGLCRV